MNSLLLNIYVGSSILPPINDTPSSQLKYLAPSPKIIL